jgi:hypothetical protein
VCTIYAESDFCSDFDYYYMQPSNFSSCSGFSLLTAIDLKSNRATFSIPTLIFLHLCKAGVAFSIAERSSSLPNTVRWRWRRGAKGGRCACGHGCNNIVTGTAAAVVPSRCAVCAADPPTAPPTVTPITIMIIRIIMIIPSLRR